MMLRMPIAMTATTTHIHAFTLPAIRVPQDAACAVDADRIVAPAAERFGLPRFLRRSRPVAALQRELCELDACAAAHPRQCVAARRPLQIVERRVRAPERRPCGAA